MHFFSSGGRTIIFTETKESASELAGLLPGARALHGDIMQAQREVSKLSLYKIVLLLLSMCIFKNWVLF